MKPFITGLIILIGMTITAAAQSNDRITLHPGQQVAARKSKLKVRFVSVVDDSRCPIGTTCVWAGNAKVRIEVSERGGNRKSFELNTTVGPKGDQFSGWTIDLVSLLPLPRAGKTIKAYNYIANITISRIVH